MDAGSLLCRGCMTQCMLVVVAGGGGLNRDKLIGREQPGSGGDAHVVLRRGGTVSIRRSAHAAHTTPRGECPVKERRGLSVPPGEIGRLLVLYSGRRGLSWKNLSVCQRARCVSVQPARSPAHLPATSLCMGHGFCGCVGYFTTLLPTGTTVPPRSIVGRPGTPIAYCVPK